ncbi:MAG: hypothetical protein WCG16_10160 [Methylococcales bacterium]
MLTEEQKKEVKKAISNELKRADNDWAKVGKHFSKSFSLEESYTLDSAPSNIPMHPLVSINEPIVDEFIALVVDMRNSSEHLKTEINSNKIQHGFQRIFFETSALLPAISVVTSFENGQVTEYLGDGALVLFHVNPDNKNESIHHAWRAARNCVTDMIDLINNELYSRYSLPPIAIGAGLAMSKAVVTLVGSEGKYHPKAIGECVWEATKLSGGTNKVFISSNMKAQWPKSPGGKLTFSPTEMKGIKCYTSNT